jgi:hypothetical protein
MPTITTIIPIVVIIRMARTYPHSAVPIIDNSISSRVIPNQLAMTGIITILLIPVWIGWLSID